MLLFNSHILKPINILSFSVVLALSGCNSDDEVSQQAGSHVSSPEWQDQIIYFLMIDRFNNGDPSLSDQGYGEYDPSSDKKFSGGDLLGVSDKLDYIQQLGATSVWITPPVANQWWDNQQNYGGYHGYWARDFQKVDEHFGNLASYQHLASEVHSRSMYLIQDIVTNHVGNYFTYDKPWEYDASIPCEGFRLIEKPLADGQTLPFPLNQNTCQDDGSGSFHWTPSITDHNDPVQEKNWQLSDLDDLNTSDPAVRAYLKDSYRKWIREVGVDAFRIDTVKFVDHDFWTDFLHADDGVISQAEQTGRQNFLTFGEVFESSSAYNTEGEQKMLSYLGEGDDKQLGSLLNFPMQTTMTRVFASGQPTDYLRFRIEKMMELFPNPYIMPNFIDNHDMPRFLSQASQADLKQALMTMLSIPGIPVIYQGTEQAMSASRDAMFEGGYREDASSKDSFDSTSEMYLFIQDLAKLRSENPVMTRGDIKVIASDKSGAGVFSFTRHLADEDVLVVMNTANVPMLLNRLDVEQAEGTVFEQKIQANWLQAPAGLVADGNGEISLELPAKSAVIYFKTATSTAVDTPDLGISLDGDWSDSTVTQDTLITGQAEPNAELQLVVNGNLSTATNIEVDSNGDWSALLSTRHFAIGEQQHRFAIYSPSEQAGLADVHFTSDLAWSSVPDIAIDDSADVQQGSGGPNGTYSLPEDPSFDKVNSQLAVNQLEVYSVGSNVRLKMVMDKLTDTWLPPNGFDHVGFSIFIDLPEDQGSTQTVLPKINATMPDGTWNRNAVVFGWQSSIYNAEGADASNWGEAVTPAPKVTVDKENQIIYLDFASEALGRPESLNGIRFYVSTWDLDGLSAVYRPLAADAGPWNFSGGDADEAKIWDELPILSLSE
ncbi:alpha-amylase family glycosyl hydrolase [Agarivorans sp. MS3-6]|uniref:alpha-amylase family glycosyl hydrolase n=1 Tax=Agarivorans sp. TSD2052 TaxID=2937286 RepID=UPI00200C362C|nr:alpha-amylase family glycosyl hydrolase [Agarivorans sp. TSD2052]UPW19623.1 alpha-amylase family glycosyl hydrolase [Agarivorans sp. TSD2052]